MAWHKDAITDGEIDALRRAALAACNENTRYPAWRGASAGAGGHCYVIACWLVHRLGGHVGADQGHYVWLSPDDRYFIDVTARHHPDKRGVYARNTTYSRIEPIANERTDRFSKRAERIFDSLDRLLRVSLDYAGDSHPAEEPQAADDSERFNDSWVAPESYWHDEPGSPTTPEGVYQFVYANGQLEVSPNHSHAQLSDHAGVNPAQHTGPFAAGHVAVTSGKATWEVQANVNLHSLFRILKDASKNYGWTWGGMTDASGQPIIEQFGPKKTGVTYNFALAGDHLYLGKTSAADLIIRAGATDCGDIGQLTVVGDRAYVSSATPVVLPYLFDWAEDQGVTLYANNDNVIKTIPDLQEKDVYSPDPARPDNPVEQSEPDERLPTGLYRCPACSQLFPNWNEYQKHRREQESWGDPDQMWNGDRGLPEPDHGIFGDGAHYDEMRQEPGITTGKVMVLPARTWKEAARVDRFMKYAKAFGYDNDDHLFYVAYRDGDPLGYAAVKPNGWIQMLHSAVENQGVATTIYGKLTRHFGSLATNAAHGKTEALLKKAGWLQVSPVTWRWSKDQAPTDMLEAPVPFIYDVQNDKIFVGHPGARTSDIPGKFTPGGIVEGNYEPGGKVVIRSLTSIPYTVRHMVELWYYTHPHLEVKSVHLQDDAGKDTRLASTQAFTVGSTVRLAAVMNPAVQTATSALTRAGGQVYAVGGVVRDAFLDKEASDIDLMVTGLPGEKVGNVLSALPGRVDFTGKDFGVFRYAHKGHKVEVALPRRESSTGAGHQDFDVQADHTMEPEEDFYRRDFTANAMGVNLADGRLVDPFGGAADIAAGTLRTLSEKSLVEDPLRIVRALVANARHGLDPNQVTRAQMSNHASSLQHLPAERIQAELDKLMASTDPACGIRLAQETGVLKHIFPEVAAAFGYDQNNPHHEHELGEHLVRVLERTAERTEDRDLRMAALLHDIGKPGSEWKDPKTGSNHFYEHHVTDDEGEPTGEILGKDHAKHGAELAELRLRELKYPNERIKRICALVEHHMWPAFTTDRGARRFLARVGDHADDLLLLRWADNGGKAEYKSSSTLSTDTQARLIARAREAGEATTQSALAITGTDLIAAGMTPGPEMGATLRYLTAQVVDDPTLNQADELLKLARSFATLKGDVDPAPQPHPQDRSAEEAEAVAQGIRPRESQKLAQGDEEAQVEPEPDFPSSADAEEIHDQALMDHGQAPEALRNPGGLESGMGRASNYWHYGTGTPGERIADAAGALAHGIGMAQAFTDGNKRTAYHTTRYFLHNNDYGHLSPVEHDDEELADHLIGHGEGTHSLEDTQALFRSRLGPDG